MSKIIADTIQSRTNAALSIPSNITSTGVLTATTFAGDATGLSGSPNISVGIATADCFKGNVSGVAATFTGNVSIAGTLTYEDVTNIDAIGLVTARSGVRITTGGFEVSAGVATVAGQTNLTNTNITAGILTASGQTNLANVNVSAGVTVSGMTSAAGGFRAQGVLVEAFSSTTTAWSSDANINISNGNLQYCSANLGGTNNTLNIRSNTGIKTDLAVGQAINVTAITAVNATSAYVNRISLDGSLTGITTSWVGGSAPTEGGGSGVDTYSFNILKLGNNTFTVVANHIKTS